jgi:hypothetical protein
MHSIMKFLYFGALLLASSVVCMHTESSTRPVYVSATTTVKEDGKTLVNIECKSELIGPDKAVEVVLRIYRPGRPVKIVNLSLDI